MKKEGITIKSKTIIKILFLIVLILAGLLVYKVYIEKQQPQVSYTDLAKQEREEVIAKVGSHIVLPNNEIPTLATVSDASQLKQYPFFQNAATGDKVLIYSQSKKAILYRPSEDKIVEIAPVMSKPTTDTSQTQTQSQNLTKTNSTSTKK